MTTTDTTQYKLGGSVKAIAPYTIKGRGVVYGGADLYGEWFTDDTDFGASRSFVGTPVFYGHAMGGIKSQIGTIKTWVPVDDGIDVEIELDRAHKYAEEIMTLVKAGALGLSTGVAGHTAKRLDTGEIKRWHVSEISLTPTPAEPRTYTEATTKGNTVRDAAGTGQSDTETASRKETQTMSKEVFTHDEVEKIVDARIKSLAGEPVGDGEGTYIPANTKTAKLPAAPAAHPYESNDYHRAFKSALVGRASDSEKEILHNAKKAAIMAAPDGIKAYNEGTANDGGIGVPTQIQREIVARRDETALIAKLPFRRYTTETWKTVIMAQGNKATSAIKPEGVASTASYSNFANSRTIQMYVDSLTYVLTEELASDVGANLEQFLADDVGRAMAQSANNFIINGTGSGQPYGLLSRVTNTSPFGATSITDAQILALLGDIKAEYATVEETGVLMTNATWFYLRALDLANIHRMTDMTGGVRSLEGFKVIPTDKLADIATTAKSVVFGNFQMAAFVERTTGVQIERFYDTETRTTKVTASWRYGFDVIQPEAFTIGVHA